MGWQTSAATVPCAVRGAYSPRSERGADMRNLGTARQIARLAVPAGAVGLCLAVFFARPSATTARAAPAAQAAEAPATRPVAGLAQERVDTAAEGFRLAMQSYRQGLQEFNELGIWSRRQAEA